MKNKDKQDYLMLIDELDQQVIEGMIDNKSYDEKMESLKGLFLKG